MSQITIKVCDIKGCRGEAVQHLSTILVCRQENGDGSFKIYSEPNVDLCGKHDFEYRRALPNMTIERKDK